ncbi:hypothetical protein PoB_003071900 [Plakobranchus ocellatus]|uniref:Uncharacterized protein n=1 Tax=Plakobranchus ocellatus TaxID=259542 RepID=A0AAV4ADB8_9GAST|nr:hypothetical protein PoB_003071900 [Plakobranchus ocellatus]
MGRRVSIGVKRRPSPGDRAPGRDRFPPDRRVVCVCLADVIAPVSRGGGGGGGAAHQCRALDRQEVSLYVCYNWQGGRELDLNA